MLQVQANQRQIESLQNQLNPQPPQQPPVVVVEKERPNNGLAVVTGMVLGAALTNSSLSCYNGRCAYGYNAPYYGGYYGGGYYYPRRRPSCSWGTGYRGCY